MFVEQGFHPQNSFWKYILGSLIAIVASFVGQIPWILAIVYSTTSQNKPYPITNEAILRFFEPNLNLFFMLFPFVIVVIALFYTVQLLHQQSFISIVTTRNKIDLKRVFFSFLLWSGFTLLSTAFFYFLNPNEFILQFEPQSFFILALIGIVLFPFQTACEELLFRGYLMQGFGNLAQNKWFPLLMTSLIFGLLHFSNPEISKIGNSFLLFYIGTGLFLGICTLMDEGMELALGFHLANNLMGALLVSSDWSIFQTHAIFRTISNPNVILEVVLPVLILFPILLSVFSKKYSWENWREKLFGSLKLTKTNIEQNDNE